MAAWQAALARHLPPAPTRVLDVGAGTGFLALQAAAAGHQVTALDLSAAMLGRLRDVAERRELAVATVQGPAHEPPPGPFDAVIERHVLWTLPEPEATLRSWRQAAPSGRLVLFESVWGAAATPSQRRRQALLQRWRRAQGVAPDHHAPYSDDLRAGLPLAAGTGPDVVAGLVEGAGWGPARLDRLHDVEWAMLAAAGPIERRLGVTPRFVVSAG